MTTFHDYDADHTLRDEMLDAQEAERERLAKLMPRLLSGNEHDREALLEKETPSALRELWNMAMQARRTDLAGSIEYFANQLGHF